MDDHESKPPPKSPQPPQPPQPSRAPSDHKTQENIEKQTEAGAGGITSQEFRQNHPQQRPPMPHELTAEWTVRAQLRFARAGETVSKEFSTNDPVNPVRVVYKWSTLDSDKTPENSQPPYEDDKHSDIFKRNSSRSSGYSQDPVKGKSRKGCRPQESFRSNASSATCADFGGADSAFSGSNTSHRRRADPAHTNGNDETTPVPFYGTRCRSTCNIIVSAVADFLPPPGCSQMEGGGGDVGQNINLPTFCNFIPEEEPDPFVFNTTACYTVQPEKSFDVPSGKVLNLRDAICQTSDTETKYFEEYEHHKRFKHALSPLERRHSQRAYDYRRATAEALLQQPPSYGSGGGANEDNSFMPSYMSSPSATAFKSASMPRIPSVEDDEVGVGPTQPLGSLPAFMTSSKTVQSAADPQKKPRTVHIDVYCTGSEDEDHADGENSTESDDNRRHDQESNSTFQTVLDNEQMRLRHQRMTGQAMPRRIVQHQPPPPPSISPDITKNLSPTSPMEHSGNLELGHGITKSSTVDEVNESKQLLFRKHIGDQRAVKLHTLRQKYLRQSSDDALSLGYPSSTRSTVRDNTCSSISSVLAGHDVPDSPWKETAADDQEDYCLAKSDSFEYENALDRLRIRQMERLWSRSHSKEDEPLSPQLPHVQHVHHPPAAGHHLQTISEVNTPQRTSPLTPRLQRDENVVASESEFYSENEQFNLHRPQHAMRTPSPNFKQASHFARNRPDFLQFFGPKDELQQHSQQQPLSAPVHSNTEHVLLYPNYNASLQRWKSETRENLSTSGTPALTPTDLSRQSSPQPCVSPMFQRSGSEAPPNTTSSLTFPTVTPTPSRRFDMYQTIRPSPAASDTSTLPPAGYSSEYLDKARKFGKVVAARKPGHHVGPTKNPNCSCESCQRWLAERFQIRGRAFSLGESPVLRRPPQ